jgi:hypothetical protein
MLLRSRHLAESACVAGISCDDILLHCRGRAGDGWCVVESLPRSGSKSQADQSCVEAWIKAIKSLPAAEIEKPGLGDMVKAGLSAIGITEERVSAAIGRPCGCSKRAEQLNELGRKIGIG